MTEPDQDATFETPAESGADSAPAPVPELAGRLTRLGAAMIDALIGIAISCPIMMFTGYIDRAMQQQVNPVEVALYTIVGIVIFLLIHGYLLATQGQTVGKMLVKVRIVDYDSSEILPFGKLLGLRYVPIWIASVIPFIGGCLVIVDVLFIFSEEKRCIHDLIAGTKVVQA